MWSPRRVLAENSGSQSMDRLRWRRNLEPEKGGFCPSPAFIERLHEGWSRAPATLTRPGHQRSATHGVGDCGRTLHDLTPPSVVSRRSPAIAASLLCEHRAQPCGTPTDLEARALSALPRSLQISSATRYRFGTEIAAPSRSHSPLTHANRHRYIEVRVIRLHPGSRVPIRRGQ
jgi:hypothetical protein